jgi:hypothetical protein
MTANFHERDRPDGVPVATGIMYTRSAAQAEALNVTRMSNTNMRIPENPRTALRSLSE